MEKKIGYACHSGLADHLARQVALLEEAGCTIVFTDDGKRRSGLRKALRAAEAGDTVMVCRADQLGGSWRQRLIAIDTLLAKQCDFTSLIDPAIAARLVHDVNYAEYPAMQTPPLRAVLHHLGSLLRRYARYPM